MEDFKNMILESGNFIKKTHLGERGVANILLSSNINGEFSICLKDEQNGVKYSWEMIMCEEDIKKVALRLAKMTGIVSLDETVNNALPADCENCDYRKFTEKFIDGCFEVMNKNGITSIEQLTEMLKEGRI